MEREVVFVQTLNKLKELGRKQGNCVSKEQVLELFKANELLLEEDKLQLVYDYLKENKIGIGVPTDSETYLTNEEVDYLETYMEEIALLDAVSEGEKEAITLSSMAGDRDAQAKLIEIYLPQVVEVAKLYAGQGVFLEDLIGEGNVALTIGVTMLGCLEKAQEAQGLLGKMMMDAMENYISENLEADKIDIKVVNRVNKIMEMAGDMAESLGRKVTPEELAKETGVSLKEINDAIRISGDHIDYFENSKEKSI